LRHIEIFHAVMTTGNLTEAARMLHTSQPTVSRGFGQVAGGHHRVKDFDMAQIDGWHAVSLRLGCNPSQPTVSRELARFEKVLGLQLFERTRGRLQPTVQSVRLPVVITA
jgi:hypothetical protein